MLLGLAVGLIVYVGLCLLIGRIVERMSRDYPSPD